MRLSRESNPGTSCTEGEHSVQIAIRRTALFTAIRNLGLSFYILQYAFFLLILSFFHPPLLVMGSTVFNK